MVSLTTAFTMYNNACCIYGPVVTSLMSPDCMLYNVRLMLPPVSHVMQSPGSVQICSKCLCACSAVHGKCLVVARVMLDPVSFYMYNVYDPTA